HPWLIRHPPNGRRIAAPLAECVPAVQLGAQHERVAERGAAIQERSVERNVHAFARMRSAAELRLAHCDIERRVQIAQRHPVYDLAEPGFFPRAVKAPVAVPLVDDVVMLGVEPTGELRVSTKCIDGAMVIPAPIDVAGASLVAPDVAELRVE